MKTETISSQKLASYVDNCRVDSQRRLFVVEFVKKDGSIRRMTIKPGIKATKGPRAWIPELTGYRFVWEVGVGWKSINLQTIRRLRVCGVEYRVEGVL